MINFKIIGRVLGVLLVIIGILMWTGLPFSWYFQSGDGEALFWSGLINVAVGGALWMGTKGRDKNNIHKREGYLIVALGWLVMVVFGMLPYLFSDVIPAIPDALFETVSGMTTTGASVITDIEATPKGILYWRSLTQWIGGMGIIVLTVAIFPLLGIGGVELFVAEAPGPTSDKLHPRIQETAKRLWGIYVGLTGILAVVFYVEGMNAYEALNHALTTMATGGFSTRNASMAAFSPTIQYTTIFFMFLAGANYTVIYYGLKGKFKRIWGSEEFRAYFLMIIFLAIFITLQVWGTGINLEQAFRDSLFQIVSLVTTTGFVSADYTSWTDGLTLLFFVLLFVGASAGSTSGGIKVIRHVVFFKNSFLEFKRILHPRAMIPLKINAKVVNERIITHIITFLLVYMFIFVVGSLVLSWMGMDFMTSIGAVATSIGNVGPGIGKVGPVDNFAWLPANVKLTLSFIMLLGRLELFTILVLFMPYFWRVN